MSELFLKTPLSIYRSGITAVIGNNLITLYHAIKCYIFRVTDQGSWGMRKLASEGYLVAEIGQGKLGKLLGMKRQTVNKIMQQLEALGWVRYDTLDVHRVCTYILGTWKLNSDGKREEAFYADKFMEDLDVNLNKALADNNKQNSLIKQGERDGDATFKEEEHRFRLTYISDYILNRGKKLMQQMYAAQPVVCFTPEKMEIQANKQQSFMGALRSIASLVPQAGHTSAPSGTPTVTLGEQGVLPEGNTEYKRERVLKNKNKKYINKNNEELLLDSNLINGEENKEDLFLLVNEETNIPDTAPLITKEIEELPLPPLPSTGYAYKDMQILNEEIQDMNPELEKKAEEILDKMSEALYLKPVVAPKIEVPVPEGSGEKQLHAIIEESKEDNSSIYTTWKEKWAQFFSAHVCEEWHDREWALLERCVYSHKKYGKALVLNAVKYYLTYWSNIKSRHNIKDNLPTIGLFALILHDAMVKESQKVLMHYKTINDIKKLKSLGEEIDLEQKYYLDLAQYELKLLGVPFSL